HPQHHTSHPTRRSSDLGMIEIPAAALCLDMFMRKLDFLSIGTNDLIQYTLAIDRADDTVAHLYDSLHPAVLRLIAHIIRSADKADRKSTRLYSSHEKIS